MLSLSGRSGYVWGLGDDVIEGLEDGPCFGEPREIVIR